MWCKYKTDLVGISKINDGLKSIMLQELILVAHKRIIKMLHSSGPPHSNLHSEPVYHL